MPNWIELISCAADASGSPLSSSHIVLRRRRLSNRINHMSMQRSTYIGSHSHSNRFHVSILHVHPLVCHCRHTLLSSTCAKRQSKINSMQAYPSYSPFNTYSFRSGVRRVGGGSRAARCAHVIPIPLLVTPCCRMCKMCTLSLTHNNIVHMK